MGGPHAPGSMGRGLSWGGKGAPQTLFELDPHPGVVLDLLDHLPAAADDDPDRVSWHRHLGEGFGGSEGPDLPLPFFFSGKWGFLD